MSTKTRNELKAQIDAGIKVNGNREITPPIHNSIETNIIDSFLNFKDGGNKVESLTGYASELTLTDRKNFTHKGYVDDAITAATGGSGGTYLKLDGTNGPMQGNVNWGAFNINNITQLSKGTNSFTFNPTSIDLLYGGVSQISIGNNISILTANNSISLNEGGGGGITIYGQGSGNVNILSDTSIDLNALGTDININSVNHNQTVSGFYSLTAQDEFYLEIAGSINYIDFTASYGGFSANNAFVNSSVGNIDIDAADDLNLNATNEIKLTATNIDGIIGGLTKFTSSGGVWLTDGYTDIKLDATGIFLDVGVGTGPGVQGNLDINFTNGGTMRLSGSTSGSSITLNAGLTGLLYAADYSTGFVARSLVDKAYVDNAIASGGGTFQSIYNNSIQPQLLINDTKGSLILQNARSVNSSTVFETRNIAGTTTFSIDGNGLTKLRSLHILDFDDLTYRVALVAAGSTNTLLLGSGWNTTFISASTASTSASTGALRVTGGSALNGTVNIGSTVFGVTGLLNVCASSGGATTIPATFQGNGISNKIYIWNTGTGAAGRASEVTFIMANDAGSSGARGAVFASYASAIAAQETTNMAFQVSSFGTLNSGLDIVGNTSAVTVNYFRITPAVTGLAPTLASVGTDANISFNFSTKGRTSGNGFFFTGNTTNSPATSTVVFANTLDAAGDATLSHLNGTASNIINRSVIRLVQVNSISAATCNTYLWGKSITITNGAEVTQFGVDTMVAGVRTNLLILDGTNGLTLLATNTRVNDLYILDFDNVTYKVGLDSPSLNTLRIGQQFTTLAISSTTTTFTTTNAVLSLNLPGGAAATGLGFRFGRQATLSHTTGTAIQISSSGSYVVSSGNGNFTLFNVDGAVNQTGGTGAITGLDVFSIPFSNITGSVYGLRSRVSSTTPGGSTELWNLYIDGTAGNYFAGNIKADGGISAIAGTSTTYAKVGGIFVARFASVSNVGTAETDLYSDTLSANMLAVNGQSVSFRYGGSVIGSANKKTLKIYFAGNLLLDTGLLTVNVTGFWGVVINLIRVNATNVRAMVRVHFDTSTNFSTVQYTELTTVTLTVANILKITGTSNGASNEVTATMALGEFGQNP